MTPQGKKSLEDELLGSLLEIGIPPRPLILKQVVDETSRQEPDLRRLGEIISADVGIAASLLKVVNSPFFGLHNKARSVHQAVSLLGLAATANAIAGIALRNVLPVPRTLERFWDASTREARLSGWLSQKLELETTIKADEAYTFALFRDCGIPIMLKRFPDYLTTLNEANHCPERMFTEIEEEAHTTSHALVGNLLAQSWWLSADTSLAIRHHHDYIMMATGCNTPTSMACNLISIAQLAEFFTQQLTGMNMTREWDKMGASILAILHLTEKDLASLLEEARSLPLSLD